MDRLFPGQILFRWESSYVRRNSSEVLSNVAQSIHKEPFLLGRGVDLCAEPRWPGIENVSPSRTGGDGFHVCATKLQPHSMISTTDFSIGLWIRVCFASVKSWFAVGKISLNHLEWCLLSMPFLFTILMVYPRLIYWYMSNHDYNWIYWFALDLRNLGSGSLWWKVREMGTI